MGKLKRADYAHLDMLVAEHGSEWIYDRLMEGLLRGEKPSSIASALGFRTYVAMKGWIEKHCSEDVELAYRARADELEWEATEAVRDICPETVGVARLQSEHYMKLAGRLDRSKWCRWRCSDKWWWFEQRFWWKR